MGVKKKLERVFIYDRADGVQGHCAIGKKSGTSTAYWDGERWTSTARVYTYKEAKRVIKRFRDKETNQALEDFAFQVRQLMEPLKKLNRPDDLVPGGVTITEIINLISNELRDEFNENKSI